MNTNNPRGAGRKPTPEHLRKVQFASRIPQWMVDQLSSKHPEKGRTELMEEALISHFKLTPPEDL